MKLYWIDIPECKWTAASYGARPEKALKDAIKIEFERRGRTHFQFDNKQFVDATQMVNYIKKAGKLDQFVKEKNPL